jgi:hypothetical protein
MCAGATGGDGAAYLVASRAVHRSSRRSHLAPLLAIASVALAACSAGDELADIPETSIAAPTTPAPTTPAPAGAAPAALFGSLGGFITAFDAVGTSGAVPDGTGFGVAEATMVTGALPSGGEGFVTADAIPNGLLGGTRDDAGEVTAVFVFVDPLTAAAAPAVLSLIGTMLATPAEFDQPAFAVEYRRLAIEASSRADAQVWTPSTSGSGHSIVTTVVAGAAGSNNLIEVAVVPFADEADAKAAVRPMRNEVVGLLAG